MSEIHTSNNSQLPTPKRPLTSRELLRDLITRNLEIIETRTSCLWARSFVAYNVSGTQTDKSMLDALSDLITAPFLRLGKQYRESPITQEIVAASRKFNNLLIDIKREATLHLRGIAKLDVFDPASQRKIDRLGLRFPIIKLDIEELIAADEADADANTETSAAINHPTPSRATTPAQAQPETPVPAPIHPADLIIAAELAKLNASPTAAATASAIAPTAPATSPTPTPPAHGTPTPPRGKPFGSPYNPNKKRNRFKKRRAA